MKKRISFGLAFRLDTFLRAEQNTSAIKFIKGWRIVCLLFSICYVSFLSRFCFTMPDFFALSASFKLCICLQRRSDLSFSSGLKLLVMLFRITLSVLEILFTIYSMHIGKFNRWWKGWAEFSWICGYRSIWWVNSMVFLQECSHRISSELIVLMTGQLSGLELRSWE